MAIFALIARVMTNKDNKVSLTLAEIETLFQDRFGSRIDNVESICKKNTRQIGKLTTYSKKIEKSLALIFHKLDFSNGGLDNVWAGLVKKGLKWAIRNPKQVFYWLFGLGCFVNAGHIISGLAKLVYLFF